MFVWQTLITSISAAGFTDDAVQSLVDEKLHRDTSPFQRESYKTFRVSDEISHVRIGLSARYMPDDLRRFVESRCEESLV